MRRDYAEEKRSGKSHAGSGAIHRQSLMRSWKTGPASGRIIVPERIASTHVDVIEEASAAQNHMRAGLRANTAKELTAELSAAGMSL